MKCKRIIAWTAALFMLILVTGGCSGGPEAEEKGAVEKLSEKSTAKAVQFLKSPLDQAKKVAAEAKLHNEMVKEAEERNK